MWLSPSTQQQDVTQADSSSTIAQNETLQAEVAQLQVLQSQLPTSSVGYIRAMVYSRYPLNFKNEILVNVGSRNGVAVGAAATFQGILIGQVQKVFSDYSIVQTVFDNGVKMPVRIGSTGADGLLQGSSYPTVGSINNAAPIMVGDIVYSAAPGLPYGLPIGTVATTSTSADSLFQQATLQFSYDINSIQTIFITQSNI
jgi:rod shape-determining protein MreC